MSTNPQPAKSLGHYALAYAAKGFHVFPLVAGQKRPLIPNGFHGATTDAAQISAWWAEYPNANIGCVPGPSGYVVIDLDGPDAETEAVSLGLTAPTLSVATGRDGGGRHLYYLRPDGHVPNGKLAPHIDVRGDAGYVILPPSRHPSGALYRWVDRTPPTDLPAALIPRILGAAPTPSAAPDGPTPHRAADIPTLERITDGERTASIVSYIGRLLAKNLPVPEIESLVLALNARTCDPPLTESKVRSTVQSMAATHLRKHGHTALVLVRPDDPSPEPAPVRAADLAADQTRAAIALLDRDISTAVRWCWGEADRILGPMLPSDLIVLGALQGNGKTTLVRTQCDRWERQGVSVLYLPLEVDPAVCRLQWAAARQNLEMAPAVRQEWDRLPEGAKECLLGELEQLEQSPYLHFVPDKRVTLPSLVKWAKWGIEECQTRVIVVDHFHRLEFGGSTDAYRIAVTEAARQLKDLGREHNLTIVCTAQLNRSSDLLDAYHAPSISRIKESAGLGEEADVVLMASRALKPELPPNYEAELKRGGLSELDLAEPNVLKLTCRKHRLDDSARDRAIRLRVDAGIAREFTPRYWS
jgi:hypothetical protein